MGLKKELVINTVVGFQKSLGTPFVYLSDKLGSELYLLGTEFCREDLLILGVLEIPDEGINKAGLNTLLSLFDKELLKRVLSNEESLQEELKNPSPETQQKLNLYFEYGILQKVGDSWVPTSELLWELYAPNTMKLRKFLNKIHVKKGLEK